MTAQIPMIVLGGFLGAGKTTLLNRILAGADGVRLAVLVNDFGDLDVDGALVTAHDGDTLRFANGCLCCAMGGDLVGALDRLLAREERRPDRIVVEASGVADPAAIADVATLHPDLARDLVVALADAETLRAHHADRRLRETIDRQLRAADLLVLNKCDRISEEACAATASWVRERVDAPIVPTVGAAIPLELLSPVTTYPTAAAAAAGSGSGSGSGASGAGSLEGVAAEGVPVDGGARPATAATAGSTGRPHGFASRTIPCPQPLDPHRLRAALASLEPRPLRAKGFVLTARAGPASAEAWMLVQACGRTVDLAPWRPPPGSARPVPAIVFIGLGDLPARSELVRVLRGACRDASSTASRPPARPSRPE